VGCWAYLDCPGDTQHSEAENHFIPGEAWIQNTKFTNNYILTEHIPHARPCSKCFTLPHGILVTIPHGIDAILTISQMEKPGSRTAYILIVVLNWGKHQNHLWSFKNRCPRKRLRNPAKSPSHAYS